MEDAEGLGSVDAADGVGHDAHLVAVTDERGEQRVGKILDELTRVERDAEHWPTA